MEINDFNVKVEEKEATTFNNFMFKNYIILITTLGITGFLSYFFSTNLTIFFVQNNSFASSLFISLLLVGLQVFFSYKICDLNLNTCYSFGGKIVCFVGEMLIFSFFLSFVMLFQWILPQDVFYDIMLQSLLLTIAIFVVTGMLLFFSNKDLSFSSSEKVQQNFRFIIFLFSFSLGLYTVLRLIASFYRPTFQDSKMDFIFEVVFLIFLIIINVYNHGVIKKLYRENSYNTELTPHLQIISVHLLFKSFIDLFIRIFRIYLMMHNKRKK